MNSGGGPTTTLDFDPLGAAVGAALLSGVLALAAPDLAALTAALVALAVAGWASRLRSVGPVRRALARPDRLFAGFLLVGASAAFIDPPPPLTRAKALLLAFGVLPLWLVERRAPSLRPREMGGT